MGLDLNPGMVATAHALTASTDVPITWREGRADALPYAEASFDVVLCQQGLQFFPDRAAALREMHRVLTPGGRLALSVWRSLQHNPYVGVLAEAVTRHVSPEAGVSMRAPCAFGDIEALRTIIRAGGFRESCIRIAVRLLRIQAVEEFILGQLAATPLAGAIAALAASTREALLNEISEALRAYRDAEGVAVPLEAHVVVAQA
jgi:SAM-dependent methyltransferase